MSALKIDTSFTAGLPDDTMSRKIVTAFAGLAADLNLTCSWKASKRSTSSKRCPLVCNYRAPATGPKQLSDPTGRTDANELGEEISIAVIKLSAGDPAHRIGTLFVKPGGPGNSGVTFVRDETSGTVSASVRARFDIVGFDPRGVGASTPLQCSASDADEAAVFADVPVFAVNHPEVIASDQANATLSKACADHEPELAAHLSTGDVARDLDRAPTSCRDHQITFVGYPYGTYIDALYANMFPGDYVSQVEDS